MPDWSVGAEGEDPTRAGLVDPERALAMTEQDVINCVLASRRASQAARRPLEGRWRYHEALYHLRTDDPEKEEWQAQIACVDVENKVETMLNMLQGALLDAPEYFGIVSPHKIYDGPDENFLQKWMQLVADDGELINGLLSMWRQAFLLGSGCMEAMIEEFASHRPHVEMRPVYSDPQMAFEAAMQGMPTMRPQVVVDERIRNRFRWRQRSIWTVFPDPVGPTAYDGKFFDVVDLVFEEDLEEMVRAGVYDSIENIGAPSSSRDISGLEPWRLGLAETKGLKRRQHLRDRFIGNIYDREGHLVAKNWRATVINEKALVQVGPNDAWRGKFPFVWSTPRPYDGRVWGRSSVDATAKIQHEKTDLINLGLDDIKYVALGSWRYDPSKAEEPQVPESIAPGEVFSGKPGLIERLTWTSNVNQIWPLVQFMDGVEAQETQISESIDGRPTSRGRPSAREIMTKAGSATAQVHAVAKRLEDDDVTRALELQKDALLEYGDDFSDPSVAALLEEWGGPQEFATREQRYMLLDRPFKIRVFGLSLLLDRQSLLERLQTLIGIVMQLGLPPPNMLQTLYTFISALGFEPAQLGFPPTPEAFQQMLAMQQQQAAAQAGGAVPQGPPMTGAPGVSGPSGLPSPELVGAGALASMSQGMPPQGAA